MLKMNFVETVWECGFKLSFTGSCWFPLDSVWPVYIPSEDVGNRVHTLGVNLIALRSRKSDTQPGQLDIISPTDPTPIVTWDRDKMRRTGCLGNMVFIEIGRRCKGGPGLVWMFAGPADLAALRETLHRYASLPNLFIQHSSSSHYGLFLVCVKKWCSL